MVPPTDRNLLSGILKQYVNRSGYTAGQLSRLTGIPKPTTVNWLSGRVKKPRCRADMIRLARVLHLSQGETSGLLEAAGYPAIPDLLRTASAEERELLSPWSHSAGIQAEGPPFQAIPDLPYFVGRQATIQTISQALGSNQHTGIYVIQGMPGVGKTTLAARIAYRMRPYFPDGVLWARLDNSDPMSILDTFGRPYGLDASRYTNLASRSRVYRELLGDKRVLLILDNVNSSQEIRPLLPPTGPAAVLVTTRHQDLWIAAGARRFLLGPFSREEGHAVELFSHFLGENTVLEEKPIFLEIADILGHHPLAIAIAASRLAYEPCWTALEFLERLREDSRRLEVLTFNDQSVRLSLEHSYQALPPEQQSLFAQLAVFGGFEFSPQAAASVANREVEPVSELLRHLYCLSFVQSDRRNRYYLHPVIQDYASEKLPRREAHKRMVLYYLHFLEQKQRDYQAIEALEPNLHYALKTALEHGMHQIFIRGVNAFRRFLEVRGLHAIALNYLRQAESAARDCGDRMWLGITLRNLGRIEYLGNRLNRAGQALNEALSLARQTQSDENVIETLSELGVLEIRRNNYSQAERYLEESLSVAHAQGMMESCSMLLSRLGVVAFKQGEFTRARALLEEGLPFARQSGDLTVIGAYLTNLGVIHLKLDENKLGENYLQEAMLLAERTGHKQRKCLLHLNMGEAALKLGNFAGAQTNLQAALEIGQDLRDLLLQASILLELGELRLKQERLEPAAQLFHESLSVAIEGGCKESQASALFGLARLEAARGRRSEALGLGEQSYDLYQSIQHVQTEEVRLWLQSFESTCASFGGTSS